MSKPERPIPDPIPDPDTLHFWEEAKAGRFLVKRCTSCGEAHWYPRAVCPFCMSLETVWEPAQGRGTIHSFSVLRRVKEPYAIAYVALAEGPLMMSNIVDCDFDSLKIGQAVEVVFKPSVGGWAVPMWRVAG